MAGVPAVERAFAVLECIALDGQASSVRAIAARTGYPSSSVHRILQTLESERLVTFDEGQGVYHLGTRIRTLSLLAPEGDLRAIAKPFMVRLARRTEENVTLSIRLGVHRRYVEQIESRSPLQARARLGEHYPIYTGASGRALLFRLPDSQIDSLLQEALMSTSDEASPEDLDHSIEGVWKTLREARRRGYAIARNEVIPGLASIAVPVMSRSDRPVASLAISGPSARLSIEDLAELHEPLSGAAQSIASTLPPTVEIDSELSAEV
jgi:IclR family transcriptional regulator, KDG regulon repressor